MLSNNLYLFGLQQYAIFDGSKSLADDEVKLFLKACIKIDGFISFNLNRLLVVALPIRSIFRRLFRNSSLVGQNLPGRVATCCSPFCLTLLYVNL